MRKKKLKSPANASQSNWWYGTLGEKIQAKEGCLYNWSLTSITEILTLNLSLTSFDNEEVEPVKSVQMNIKQSNTYRKDFSWPDLDDKRRVQKKQQVKGY